MWKTEQNKILDGLDIFFSWLASFCSHMSSARPPSANWLMASLQFWESCSQSVYFKRVYHCQVITAGLWFYGSPILRVDRAKCTCSALIWTSPLALVGSCISVAPEETASSGSDGHMVLWFSDSFIHISLLLTLMLNGLNLSVTWRCRDGKVLVCWKRKRMVYTSNSNHFFFLFYFHFFKT